MFTKNYLSKIYFVASMFLNRIEKHFLIFMLSISILTKTQFIINMSQLKFTQKRFNKLLTLYSVIVVT
jgi:hypothetical protein